MEVYRTLAIRNVYYNYDSLVLFEIVDRVADHFSIIFRAFQFLS